MCFDITNPIITSYFLFPALAEQLVSEVKRLQQELAITKSKLQSASEMISKMPSEGIKMVAFIEGSCLLSI